MFDLLTILRIRVLWIPGDEALVAALSTTTIRRACDLKQTSTPLADWFGSFPTATFMPQVLFRWGEKRVCRVRCIGDHNLFYIGWSLGFPIIPLMSHPDIHSLSPYQLIKYLINYPIRNLIALLLNLITNQLRLTIDK